MIIQTLHSSPTFHGFSTFHSHISCSSSSSSPFLAKRFLSLVPFPSRNPLLKFNSTSNDSTPDQDYLLDAPESIGDGFSFSGGKYSDEPSPSDE
ncbi:hypothetical protein HN51_053999 [Arachis hypogaea]|uniref:uncharacterized protein LOC110266599 isoform X2 n=1 Tax=Arachis ipaensis TaxID=130454 RepID=UPI000A2B6137|nr:uncharacterized protein LOC110266599 isoform X2 [Arachis ipaensis]